MSCEGCGRNCHGRRCNLCQLEDRLEREDPDAGQRRWNSRETIGGSAE